MRQFLIHAFWGVYIIRLGKKKLSFLRASTILFPYLLLAAVFKAANLQQVGIIFLALFILGVLVDFAYLKLFPPVWQELSPRQKASIPANQVLGDDWFEYISLKNKYYE